MKLGKIVHLTARFNAGGSQAVLYELVTRLQGTYAQSVISFADGAYCQRLKEQGIRVYIIRGLICQYDPVFWIRLGWRLHKERPYCLHVLLWPTTIIGRIYGWLLKIPVVTVFHIPVNSTAWLSTLIDRLTLPLAHTVVAVSPSVAASLDQYGSWGPCREQLSVIMHGIDAQALQLKGLQFQKSRYELGLSEEHLVIGAVGKLYASKRYDLLLESFALVNMQYPLTRLVLIGQGPEERMLRKKARVLGIDQDILILNAQATGYYPLFDCFVQPSDTQGISIALLEAMSFGLPCVVAQLGNEHPVIKSGHNGLVVQEGNARALAHMLITMVEHEGMRIALGRNGQETVLHSFNVEQMVCAYDALFAHIRLTESGKR